MGVRMATSSSFRSRNKAGIDRLMLDTEPCSETVYMEAERAPKHQIGKAFVAMNAAYLRRDHWDTIKAQAVLAVVGSAALAYAAGAVWLIATHMVKHL